MLRAFWNWLKGLFGGGVATQLVLTDIAFRIFQRNSRLAGKALAFSDEALSMIAASPTLTYDKFRKTFQSMMIRTGFTPEEELLMQPILDELTKQVQAEIDKATIVVPAAQLAEAAKYIAYIQNAAQAALK